MSGVRLNCLVISFLQVGSFKVRGDRNGQIGKGKKRKRKGVPFTRDSALSLCIGSSNLSSQSCKIIPHLCSQSFVCVCVCERERWGGEGGGQA